MSPHALVSFRDPMCVATVGDVIQQERCSLLYKRMVQAFLVQVTSNHKSCTSCCNVDVLNSQHLF